MAEQETHTDGRHGRDPLSVEGQEMHQVLWGEPPHAQNKLLSAVRGSTAGMGERT